MPSELMIITSNILQSCMPLLSLSAYLPQWKKLFLTRSSSDISLRSWTIWSISALITVFYAIIQYQVTGSGIALVFSNLSTLVFAIATIYVVHIYRTKNKIN